MKKEIIEILKKEKILAILRGIKTEKVLSVAEALYNGGVRLLEITFPQNHPEQFDKTLNGIEAVREQLGDRLTIGAGTVITVEQVEMAHTAGAQFIVSPNIDTEIIAITKKLGMVSIPGAMTPTEILKAYDGGADCVKVFPASVLGTEYMKAVRAPLSHVPLLAVGGVNSKNIHEFLNVGVVGVGVGGCLVKADAIQRGDYESLTAAAIELIEAMNNWNNT